MEIWNGECYVLGGSLAGSRSQLRQVRRGRWPRAALLRGRRVGSILVRRGGSLVGWGWVLVGGGWVLV